MTTLALYSNKDRIGKTAAAVNIAYLAAKSGKKTLICDLDLQGATTFYLRVKPKVKRKAQGLAKGGKAIEDSIKGTDYENLDLLWADFTHRNLDIVFDQLKRPKERLRKVLKPFEKEYDLIVLDCPPTINILAENIFNAADILLTPLIPTTLSLFAHEQLLVFLRESDYAPGKALPLLLDGRQAQENASRNLWYNSEYLRSRSTVRHPLPVRDRTDGADPRAGGGLCPQIRRCQSLSGVVG